MSHAPVRILHPLPLSNRTMIYRTCEDCQMEVSWPMKQTSLTHCPYCDTPYRQSPFSSQVKALAARAGLTILVCCAVIGFVGLLVRIGSRLFL